MCFASVLDAETSASFHALLFLAELARPLLLFALLLAQANARVLNRLRRGDGTASSGHWLASSLLVGVLAHALFLAALLLRQFGTDVHSGGRGDRRLRSSGSGDRLQFFLEFLD